MKQNNFTNIDGEAITRRVGDWIEVYLTGRVEDEHVGKIIGIRPEFMLGLWSCKTPPASPARSTVI